MVNRAGNGSTPEPEQTYDIDLSVNTIDIDNFYDAGSSKRLVDALPGQEFRAQIDVTKRYDDPIDGVFEARAGNWGDLAPMTELDGDVRQVRDHTELDALSRNKWSFDSKDHREDLEGWTACYPGHHDDLIYSTRQAHIA